MFYFSWCLTLLTIEKIIPRSTTLHSLWLDFWILVINHEPGLLMLNLSIFGFVCMSIFFLSFFFPNKEKRLQLLNYLSDIGIQQRMISSGHSKTLLFCPKSGGGKACAVELSCSQDTYLCPQEIICQALFGFFVSFVFVFVFYCYWR